MSSPERVGRRKTPGLAGREDRVERPGEGRVGRRVFKRDYRQSRTTARRPEIGARLSGLSRAVPCRAFLTMYRRSRGRLAAAVPSRGRTRHGNPHASEVARRRSNRPEPVSPGLHGLIRDLGWLAYPGLAGSSLGFRPFAVLPRGAPPSKPLPRWLRLPSWRGLGGSTSAAVVLSHPEGRAHYPLKGCQRSTSG